MSSDHLTVGSKAGIASTTLKSCAQVFLFFMCLFFSISGNAAASAVPGDDDRYAWLEEREGKPDDFNVRGEEYKGPKIVGY
ncbi:hypothetical protein GW17_00058578 [Ensete ventricosum]|nr:hypothetical protein GW17_00058578 [Ensete ventricosum]